LGTQSSIDAGEVAVLPERVLRHQGTDVLQVYPVLQV
jgi:hypothetical protein